MPDRAGEVSNDNGILRAIEEVAAKMPPRNQTLALVLIYPGWASNRILQIDGPHTRTSLMVVLGVGGVEAWEHVRTRSEYRIIVGGPAFEHALHSIPNPARTAVNGLGGVPVVRLRDTSTADDLDIWREYVCSLLTPTPR